MKTLIFQPRSSDITGIVAFMATTDLFPAQLIAQDEPPPTVSPGSSASSTTLTPVPLKLGLSSKACCSCAAAAPTPASGRTGRRRRRCRNIGDGNRRRALAVRFAAALKPTKIIWSSTCASIGMAPPRLMPASIRIRPIQRGNVLLMQCSGGTLIRTSADRPRPL